MPIPMTVVWGVAMVIFLIVEGVTAGLASIWFAIGALAALISAQFGAPIWLQVLWFIVISALTLWLTRPLAKKFINTRRQATNADRAIGQTVRITETVDNLAGTGTARADGKDWTARSADGTVLPAGSLAVVESIQGVKLIIRAQAAEETPEAPDLSQQEE